jgi:hypothetical protein
MSETPKTPVSEKLGFKTKEGTAPFNWAALIGAVAAVVSIIAGIYLFQTESASEEATIFDALFKALGAYMVARGLWMIASLTRR